MKKLLFLFCLLPVFSYAQADFSKADKLVNEKKYKKANREYSKIIKNNPNSYQAYLKRAYFFYRYPKATWNKAIVDYSKVIELNDTVAEAYAIRGLIYYYSSLKDDSMCKLAVADFDRAIELKAKEAGKLYYARGHCKSLLDRYDIQGACADFMKAKELGYKSTLVDTKNYCGW